MGWHDFYLMLDSNFRSVVLLNNRTNVGEHLSQSEAKARGRAATLHDLRGVRTHFDIEIKLNTPGVRNGVFTLYVNGKRQIHAIDVVYRDRASDLLRYVMMPGQHGGQYGPTKSFGYQLDNLEVRSELGTPLPGQR